MFSTKNFKDVLHTDGGGLPTCILNQPRLFEIVTDLFRSFTSKCVIFSEGLIASMLIKLDNKFVCIT